MKNFLLAAGVAFLGSTAAADEPIRIAGSATAAQTLVAPRLSVIEAIVGGPIALAATNSRDGLQALVDGHADLAVISASWTAVAARDEQLRSALRAASAEQHLIGASEARIVVNPRLTAHTLDQERIASIFRGEITSWAEIGGPDMPILVLAPPAGEGARVTLERHLLDGASMTDNVRVLARSKDVARAVEARINAIGIVDAADLSVGQGARPLTTQAGLGQPVFLVVTGEAKPAVRRLLARSNEVF